MRQITALLMCAAWLLPGAPRSYAQTPPRPVIQSWGYQTTNLDPATLAASAYDALVIDYSRDGTEAGRLTAADVQAIKRRPDGRRRVVLAYVSIGAAETSRGYWHRGWENWSVIPNFWSAPTWRARESSQQRGAYAVRYWDPAWQQIIVGQGGYLDKIIDAGFDGVWLAHVGAAFEPVASGRDTAQADMIAFVRKIRERGRSANTNFLIVPENGEGLLADGGYRALIDGMGVEDLYFGDPKPGTANDPKAIARRRGLISLVVAERKPVLAVEYLDDAASIVTAKRELQTLGFLPHFANRERAQLRIGDLPPPAAAAETGASAMRQAARRGFDLTTLVLLAISVIFVALGLLRRKSAP